MNWNERYYPSWTGGVAVPKRKYCEATADGTDGVVVQIRSKMLEQPPRPLHVDASRLFIDVAATPPVQEGQWRSFQFLHTFIERPYSS
jgi:hypothetical protein